MRGHREPLTPERRDLAERYIPLARKIIKPFKIRWPEHRDDFDSAAYLAICEAAEAFDESRGIKFATYAKHRVKGAIHDVQRSLVAFGYRCDPKNAPTVATVQQVRDGHHAVRRVLCVSDPHPVGSDLAERDAVEFHLRKLPDRHAQALRLIYVHGKTQHEAARVMGVSQSRLSYMHREALAILDGSWEAGVMEAAT